MMICVYVKYILYSNRMTVFLYILCVVRSATGLKPFQGRAAVFFSQLFFNFKSQC